MTNEAGYCPWLHALALAGCASTGTPGAAFSVKLIGFNDYHGNLQSPGSFAPNLARAGGAARAGGRRRVHRRTCQQAEGSEPEPCGGRRRRHDRRHAADLVAVPRRARRWRRSTASAWNSTPLATTSSTRARPKLLRLQRGGCKMDGGKIDANSCQGAKVGTPVPFEGAKFQWLSANVIVTATGQTLLPAYGVKRFQGVPVAFIGMTLKDTPGIVVPTGVAGLEFRDEAATVNALVPKLRAEGIEAIVVLVHEGGMQSGGLQDINACAGNLRARRSRASSAQLDDAVDLVISGHTHAAYNCRLPNAKGRPLPVSSANAFGRVLTDIDLALDPATRDIVAVQVDQPAGRPQRPDGHARRGAGRHRQGLRRAGRAARRGGHRRDRHRTAQQRQRCRLQHAGRRTDRRRATGRHHGTGPRRRRHRLHEPWRRAHARLHLQAARRRRRRQCHLRRGFHHAALRQQPGDDDADGAAASRTCWSSSSPAAAASCPRPRAS